MSLIIFFLNLKLQSYNKNSLNGSSFDHIARISVHSYYEYFNNQVTGPGLGPGPLPGPKFKRDWDRDHLSGPEMTGTGTNYQDKKCRDRDRDWSWSRSRDVLWSSGQLYLSSNQTKTTVSFPEIATYCFHENAIA